MLPRRPLPFTPSRDRIEAGVDEAGRGSLAGPVFAAAVIWSPDITDGPAREIRDSKKLSRSVRQRLRGYIEDNALSFAVSSVSNSSIDESNILDATMDAMHAALSQLDIQVDVVLVDGSIFRPFLNVPHICIPGGDDQYASIAAASILAKEYHDDYMRAVAKEFPEYSFDKNMGYGTLHHLEALATHGPTPIHRRTFRVEPRRNLKSKQLIKDHRME